jgi:predicted amidohydrolase YtcJ
MILWLLGCAHRSGPDLLFVGGNLPGALAVDEGRVLAVGEREALRELGRPRRTIHLRGRALLPGFVDSHSHPAEGGVGLLWADLSEAATVQELLDEVARHARPEDPWVLGSGWDLPTFAGRLDRAALDAAFPDRPVFLSSADGHQAWVNAVALQLAGVSSATGLVEEHEVDAVAAHVPDPTEAQADEGLRRYLELAASHGITTAVDANTSEWQLAAYRRAQDRGALTVRLRAAVGIDGPHELAQVEALRDRYASGRLQVDAVKVYVDGVLETGTAALLAPYTDGSVVPPDLDAGELAEILREADARGLRVHAHTIGDAAVRAVLDATALVRPRQPPVLAHLELVHPDDVPRFAALGAIAAVQPLWAWPDPWVTELTVPRIGAERAERLYPIGGLLQSGAQVVGGSDWDVTTLDVLDAIEVAVLRQDPDRQSAALAPDQAATVEQMLRAYTGEGLAPGSPADLVLISRDPASVPPQRLSELRIRGTWLEGQRVWPRAGRGGTTAITPSP